MLLLFDSSGGAIHAIRYRYDVISANGTGTVGVTSRRTTTPIPPIHRKNMQQSQLSQQHIIYDNGDDKYEDAIFLQKQCLSHVVIENIHHHVPHY